MRSKYHIATTSPVAPSQTAVSLANWMGITGQIKFDPDTRAYAHNIALVRQNRWGYSSNGSRGVAQGFGCVCTLSWGCPVKRINNNIDQIPEKLIQSRGGLPQGSENSHI